jgi:F-type H+-transporting ATPase subunit delta
MTISPKQYAQSLYETVADQGAAAVKAVLKNFVRVLGRRGELAKAGEIITRFTEIWNRAKGELEAELASARALGPTTQDAVIDYLKTKTGAKAVKLQETIRPELIGGFVLRYDDRVIDGSLRHNLEVLKNKISN